MADQSVPRPRIRPIPRDRFVVDVAVLLIRIIGGVIFMAHGAQKLFGAFGGDGLSATMSADGPGGGGILGLLVAIGEFFGGLGLVVGLLTRFSAAAIILIMVGAIAIVHWKNGFFLSNRGFEYNLALIGLMLAPLIVGPGRYAISQYLPLPGVRRSGRPILPLE